MPESRASEDDLAGLRAIVGEENVELDDEARIVHWAGRSVRDLLRTRRGDFTRVPDAVVYPGDEEETRALLAAASERNWVVIPFGGGTSISGSLNAWAVPRQSTGVSAREDSQASMAWPLRAEAISSSRRAPCPHVAAWARSRPATARTRSTTS